HGQRRRLAGAVRAEDPEAFAALDLEVDDVDDRPAVVALGEPPSLDDGPTVALAHDRIQDNGCPASKVNGPNERATPRIHDRAAAFGPSLVGTLPTLRSLEGVRAGGPRRR